MYNIKRLTAKAHENSIICERASDAKRDFILFCVAQYQIINETAAQGS